MTIQRIFLYMLCTLGFALQVHAQSVSAGKNSPSLDYFLPQEIFTYRRDIPTPKDFFGFELGEQHLNNNQVVAYMQALAKISPRISLQLIGHSYEHRELIVLQISSPENQNKLEQIRAEQVKLVSPSESDRCNIKQMPIVVWLGYSVHGNEPSGVNASIAVAYFLAAAEGPEIDKILSNSVILIQPAINPDGVQRFAEWANASRSFTMVSDPNSREFREPMPGSRSNHYWFDLNRDWVLLQHPESIQRMQYYYRWRPTMVNDYHEQGISANYYFSPGEVKQTHRLIPASNWKLTKKIAAFHAAELDKIGTVYYSKEGYDDFYPGKGGCMPDFHGAIGILYEQASSRGHFQERPDGIIRSFASTIRNQAYCSYSAIRAAVAMRTELLEYQRKAYKEVQQMAKADLVQGYVFGAKETEQLDHEFFKILQAHQIEVYQLDKSVKVKDRSFNKAHAYIIPAQQKEYRLLKSIMERNLNYADSSFYDISTWTFPLAFNLHYAELTTTEGLTGPRISEFPIQAGNVLKKSDYAYIFDVHSFYSAKLIYKLQEAGLVLKTALQPLNIKIDNTEQHFDYGAVLVSVIDQAIDSQEIFALLQGWASQAGVTVYPLSSSTGDNFDVGGRNFRSMDPKPVVAVLTGSGSDYGGAGEIWHLFDQRLNIPLTLLETSRLDAADLSRYNTLVLYGNYRLSKEQSDKIKAWHSAGGKVIAIGGAWRNTNAMGISLIQVVEKEIKPENTAKAAPQYLPYADRSLLRYRDRIPGVILECRLDRSSPIAYGIIENTIPSFRESTDFLKAPANPYSCPVSYVASPLLSGCISPAHLKQVANTPAVLTAPRLVYFADEPVYRAYWFGTTRLFLNAIFFPL